MSIHDEYKNFPDVHPNSVLKTDVLRQGMKISESTQKNFNERDDIMSKKKQDEMLAAGKEEILQRSRERRGGLIEDTVAEMNWWVCFKEGTDATTSAYPATAKQPIVEGKKIGRNDPCPCGSGKKYKKCCLH